MDAPANSWEPSFLLEALCYSVHPFVQRFVQRIQNVLGSLNPTNIKVRRDYLVDALGDCIARDQTSRTEVSAARSIGDKTRNLNACSPW